MNKKQMERIIKAIKTGNYDYIDELCIDNTDWLTSLIVDENGNEKLAIHYACRFGQLEMVQLFLEKKSDLLDAINTHHRTPISFAAAYGHTNIVEYLAQLGADLTIATHFLNAYYLPIHWAAERGHHQVIECLIKHGADIDMVLDGPRYHLIHIAAISGQLNVIQMLLNKNPHSLTAKDAEGQTAVHLAASRGHLDMLQYLLNYNGEDLTPADKPLEVGIEQAVTLNLSNSKNSHMWLNENQSHLIHIAAAAGQQEIVNFLLQNDPDLLNIVDVYGQTPLYCAAANGHANVVSYLISKNANLDIVTNWPGHEDRAKSPLTIAMENQYYDVANLIILKITVQQNKEAILPFIQTGAQALQLMMMEPALINMMFQDERIACLISATNCNIDSQSIHYYQPSGRRSSWFASINRTTSTSSLFKPVHELGKGANGIVRLFQNADGQCISVKSPKNRLIDLSQNDREYISSLLKKEAAFNKQAYPDGHYSNVFEFDDILNNHTTYHSRYVMPYVKGLTAGKFMRRTRCSYLLAKTTLRISQEIQRVHEVGIIHGDLNPNNIMIDYSTDNLTVCLIDFGCSSDITAPSAPFWKPNPSAVLIPPELRNRNNETVKPHASQDVYTFGAALHLIFYKHSSRGELLKQFPSIHRFTTAAQDINPKERPSLASFCIQLESELALKPDDIPLSQNIEQANESVKNITLR